VAADYIEEREANFFIRGSRVSLDSVVYGFLNGESAETIRDNYPTLSLEQVYGAIAYYLAHQVVIDPYLETKHVDFEKARRSQTHVSNGLRARLLSAREHLIRRP
jgi:uncharacterized protein (DUF433 family)